MPNGVSKKLETKLFGHTLRSPFVIGSGPVGYGAAGIIAVWKAGAGAVTTKTIRDKKAENPVPHIAYSSPNTMVNAEKWTDFDAEQWVEREIPASKKEGVFLIGSIGHTPGEARNWTGPVDRAGADIIELVSYEVETIVEMTRIAKKSTSKPVVVKLSPNWADPVRAALEAIHAGADGLTAMDSVGPVLRIDIRTARPLLGSVNGFGWLTGSAIKPVVLRYVAEIAMKTNIPIIGTGGVMNEEDALEMLMAGASAVGVCTAPILKGTEYLTTLNKKTEKLMESLGYGSIGDVSRAALRNFPKEELFGKPRFSFDREVCTRCLRCVTACPYDARSLDHDKTMELDEKLCRLCGLCASVCPRDALRMDRNIG